MNTCLYHTRKRYLSRSSERFTSYRQGRNLSNCKLVWNIKLYIKKSDLNTSKWASCTIHTSKPPSYSVENNCVLLTFSTKVNNKNSNFNEKRGDIRMAILWKYKKWKMTNVKNGVRLFLKPQQHEPIGNYPCALQYSYDYNYICKRCVIFINLIYFVEFNALRW